MSSWLNFNDSFNNIKGQITNLAKDVLAVDEENEHSEKTYEEINRICQQQELQIQELLSVIEANKLKVNNGESSQSNAFGDTWNWQEQVLIPPKPESSQNDDTKTVENLKKLVEQLKTEKNELETALEQLDSDNQQNISEIMSIKDKLQEENNEVKEKCEQLQQMNKKFNIKEANFKKSFEELKSKYDALKQKQPSTPNETSNQSTIIEENRKLKHDIEECQKELTFVKSANLTLQKVLEDLKNADEDSVTILQNENKLLYAELQKSKQAITEFERKNIEDTENCAKLADILDSYEKQVSALKEELSTLHSQQDNIAGYDQLIKELKAANNQSLEDIEKLSVKYESLSKQYKELTEENQGVHKKYVNIVTENVKRYLEGEKTSDSNTEEDNELSEFKKQVENILDMLLDFKTKIESLEKEVFELNQDKNKILSEKNHEIEKLIQNSEELSQEVISKSRIVKEYENECSELEKNNELLIKELDAHKNNSGLQTITETNEENVIMLESEVEDANKRINYLEGVIDDYEKHKTFHEDDSIPLETQLDISKIRIEELEKIILDMENEKDSQNQKLEVDTTNKSHDFQDLLGKYDQLLIDSESYKHDLKVAEGDLKSSSLEIENLNHDLDKLKSDLENSEYQSSELNINMEGLKDELELAKMEIERILKEKQLLMQRQNENDCNTEDIRTELNFVREQLLLEEDQRRKGESEIRMLKEKLQACKISETQLKLQCDALSKELVVANEGKNNLNTSAMRIKELEGNCLEMKKKNEELVEDLNNMRVAKDAELVDLKLSVEELEKKLSTIENKNDVIKETIIPVQSTNSGEQLKAALEGKIYLENDMKDLQTKLTELVSNHEKLQQAFATKEKEIEQMNASRNELIAMVKTKDQESVTYYNEIQRLMQMLQLESEKSTNLEMQQQNLVRSEEFNKLKEEHEKLTDQNGFLKQKCEVLAENLLQEQSKVQTVLSEKSSTSEREQSLLKELDRLKTHLIEVEETLTQELVEAERKNAELLSKVKDIEEKEKNSSTMYTSISIRANQQVEVLQKQVQSLTSQREELRRKMSDAEDENNKKGAALANLQFVLEQFRKDKEKDVHQETERIRRQIAVEKSVQEELKREIHNIKQQLEESKQGLQAAARLSEQLELSKRLTVTLKEEVTQLQSKLDKSEEKVRNIASQTDGKVEKSLVKNLIIGYVSSNPTMNKDQSQILKIIATVLDFNQQDHDKLSSSKAQNASWLGSLLSPQNNQNLTQESLSQAFVKFLENESKPRVVPSLLSEPSTTKNGNKTTSTTSQQSPIVLSEIMLPTFADFAQNRNSSSILKDVLKDSTNSS
ncbi:unnamed protein product [Brassicogethes aeneus]|uniref:GRIP domain-containing protein n=1 Tax=Brassicogethes aeneus TaxID=1431903 RepID=A0A9P0FBJ9_BRAAE|nr:unnamed protein product [Brassicogethes aeneus]